MQTYTTHNTEREITQFIVLSFFNEFCFKIRTVVVYWVFVCLFFFNFSMNHFLQSRIIRMSFLLCEVVSCGCCRQNGDFSNSILIFRIFVRFCSDGRVYKCNYNDKIGFYIEIFVSLRFVSLFSLPYLLLLLLYIPTLITLLYIRKIIILFS